MISILQDLPEAVLRSYWARHWACAVDVMELLSTEAALLPGEVESLAVEASDKRFSDLKYGLVKLINEQYRPGGQYYIPVCDMRLPQLAPHMSYMFRC